MGFLKNIKDKFKDSVFDDDEEEDEEVEGEEEEEEEEIIAPKHTPEPAPQQPQQRTAPAPSPAKVKIDGAALELKVVKPERYEDVPQIADHLLNRRTVVLNLEASNKEISRRIIDFLSGVAYALDGRLSNVAMNTYLITPAHVSVTGEDLSGKADEDKEEFAYPED